MIITLPNPDLYFDKRIQQIAVQHGCYARVKWVTPREVRFVLVERAGAPPPATFEQHDAVISALLDIAPEARIRTARATFEGKADFEAQKAARQGIARPFGVSA